MRDLNSSFDYLSKDYKGYKNAMIERLKVLMPEYTDLSETDAGIIILELASVGLDILSAYLDSQANESLLVSAELWSSVLKWAKMLSYEPRFATSSIVEQVFKLKAVSDQDTVIMAGTQVMTSNITNETPIYFETVENLTIPAGKLGDETDDEGKYLYTVDTLQGVSILGEVIGTSNGAKDQEFKLGYSPVVYNTIEIWCDGIKWTKAENNSFVNSESGDTHYTLTMNDLNEAVVIFGDNVFGKIPPKDSQIFAYYRVGGGTEGNVAPNTVTMPVQTDARIDKTFNPYLPKEYGQDRESLKSIKLSAPALSRTTWGAITLRDFTDILLANFPQIKLAKTIRGDKSQLLNIVDADGNLLPTADDVVIGIVQNKDGEEFTELSDDLKAKIQEAFEIRKIAGMNDIYLCAVEEAPITEVEFNVSLYKDYAVGDNYTSIAKNIKEAVIEYFRIGNVNIDQEVSPYDIEKYIRDNVTGLDYLHFVSMSSPNYYGIENPTISAENAIKWDYTTVLFKLLTANEDSLVCKVHYYNNNTEVQV